MGNAKHVEKYFQKIKIKKPSEVIIEQIKDLIHRGILKPGDRIPSVQSLKKLLGVSRSNITEAMKKLEFYGILMTKPQSGTYVSRIGVKALEGLIANILKIEKNDFNSLADTRSLLETHAAELTASRATDEEIEELEAIFLELKEQIKLGNRGLEEDILFHLKIAECSRNNFLFSIVNMLTPTLLKIILKSKPSESNLENVLKEHEAIMEGIKSRDPEKTVAAMRSHLQKTHSLHVELLKTEVFNDLDEEIYKALE